MPKSRAKKKARKSSNRQISWGGKATKGSRRTNMVFGAIVVLALVAGGLYWRRGNQLDAAFGVLAAQGQASLSRVRTLPSRGRGHLAIGQSHSYDERFPTSGIHADYEVNPGFYREVQLPTALVNSLERGHVVVYYENPGADAIQFLKDWTSFYDGQWDGLVAVPATGLGSAVVLTAWRKMYRLDDFDPATAAAFIDLYRGRGPKNPVR
jgi:hypothetical protein